MGREKRKGLGGLTPEQKAKLKQIIMEKVREEREKEALQLKEKKENHIKSIIEPIEPSRLSKNDLQELCARLHRKIYVAESEKYDLERKLIEQETEIKDLQMKIQSKGKFVKPILRKVDLSDKRR